MNNIYIYIYIYTHKVKCSRYRPIVVQRVGSSITLLFHDLGTRKGVSGQLHAPAALYPRERRGIHFTGGWVGPRAGLDGRKMSSPPVFDPGPSSPWSVAIPTELPGPHTHTHIHTHTHTHIYIYFIFIFPCKSVYI